MAKQELNHHALIEALAVYEATSHVLSNETRLRLVIEAYLTSVDYQKYLNYKGIALG